MTTTSMPQGLFFTIDTLQFSKRLQKAGMQQEIAEELAEVLKETHAQHLDDLATKRDLLDVKREIQDTKKELENKLETKLEMLKKDIIIKLGSLMALGIGIIALLIKF